MGTGSLMVTIKYVILYESQSLTIYLTIGSTLVQILQNTPIFSNFSHQEHKYFKFSIMKAKISQTFSSKFLSYQRFHFQHYFDNLTSLTGLRIDALQPPKGSLTPLSVKSWCQPMLMTVELIAKDFIMRVNHLLRAVARQNTNRGKKMPGGRKYYRGTDMLKCIKNYF